MISKLFGEYTATILLLLAGIAVFSFGVSTNTGITLKIGATMLGAILTLVNGFKLIWLSFFDGKEDDTKFAIANPYTKKYEAVNVERWITPLTLIGLTLATGLMFMAFTFKEKPKEIIAWEDNPIPDFTEMEEPPPTDHPKPPPPIVTLPPPKIEIVKDDIVVKDEPVIEEIVIEIEEVIEIPNPEDVIGDIVEEIIIEEKIPEIVNEEPEIFEIVEEMPSFPGGDNELLKYLSKKIVTPQIALNNGIQGRVFIKFVVNEDGSITDTKIIRDIGGGCGEEVLRVVKSMPKWNPGKQRGKPVKVAYTLPVKFVQQ